jgi:hypothetical protein
MAIFSTDRHAGNPDSKIGEGEEPTVVDGRLLSPPSTSGDGFLHSLLIHHGKMPKEPKREENGGALSLDGTSFASSSSASSTPATVICFRFVHHRRLHPGETAQILIKTGISLNECRSVFVKIFGEGERINV